MALFGEKYGDEVRVVSMGHRHPWCKGQPALFRRALRWYARVGATGEIGLVRIVGESAVGCWRSPP